MGFPRDVPRAVSERSAAWEFSVCITIVFATKNEYKNDTLIRMLRSLAYGPWDIPRKTHAMPRSDEKSITYPT